MTKFNGFPEGKVRFTRLPDPLFTQLLPQVDDLAEFKVLLYFFWRLERMEGAFRYLRRIDLLEDERFSQGLAGGGGQPSQALDEALQRCVRRGSLLMASLETESGPESLYFLNSARGRAAVRAIQRGEWRPGSEGQAPASLDLSLEAPNVFRLYEEQIGPLTPMIAEKLHDAEDAYPPKWIEDAFRIAVENNVRRWSYVEAILKRWQEGGRDERTDRRDAEKDRRRYVEGEFSEFIEH